jgi:hypothetical protein
MLGRAGAEDGAFTAGAARDLVTRYAAALAPGSYVVLSVLHAESEAADEGLNAY